MDGIPRPSARVTIVPWHARRCVVAVREVHEVVREVWIEESEERVRHVVAIGLSRPGTMISPNRELADRLSAYFAGAPDDFRDLMIDPFRSEGFSREVLDACRAIPYGETRTYSDLAAAVGRPRAARAVGRIMSQNSCPILIGCHRVLRRDGTMGGYSGLGGEKTKRWLLDLEARSRPMGFIAFGEAVASLGPLA